MYADMIEWCNNQEKWNNQEQCNNEVTICSITHQKFENLDA